MISICYTKIFFTCSALCKYSKTLHSRMICTSGTSVVGGSAIGYLLLDFIHIYFYWSKLTIFTQYHMAWVTIQWIKILSFSNSKNLTLNMRYTQVSMWGIPDVMRIRSMCFTFLHIVTLKTSLVSNNISCVCRWWGANSPLESIWEAFLLN